MENPESIGISQALGQLIKQGPFVVIFLLILWAGHKKFWYWGPGVRAHFDELKADRDEWKRLALGLLQQAGIKLPENTAPGAVRDLLGGGPSREPGKS